MNPWLFVVGAVVFLLIGTWTVTHPSGGYRAVGGAGSGFDPSTRRAAGVALLVLALVLLLAAGSLAG